MTRREEDVATAQHRALLIDTDWPDTPENRKALRDIVAWYEHLKREATS